MTKKKEPWMKAWLDWMGVPDNRHPMRSFQTGYTRGCEAALTEADARALVSRVGAIRDGKIRRAAQELAVACGWSPPE